MATVETETLEQLNHLGPEDLLAWAFTNHGERAAIITSFQDTGCVMLDMAYRAGCGLRVVTIDTLRLPPETYELIERVEDRYGIKVERFQPDPRRLEDMLNRHGEFLFFDSPSKQEYCCQIRKVEPNKRALQTVDVWITGLRRDQSSSRRQVAKASISDQDGRPIIKLAPLVEWNQEQVRAYIEANDVPYSALYDQGYTSIGCVICTTPTKPWEDKRAGRWRWFNGTDGEHAKECGIHVSGSGI